MRNVIKLSKDGFFEGLIKKKGARFFGAKK